VEIRDGHSWGDLVMELGGLITDEYDGTDATKKYGFWAGEARELAADDGGWPRVLRLMGEAMAEAAVDPVLASSVDPSTRETKAND